MNSQHHQDDPEKRVSFAAILFDLDGAIVDTTSAIVQHWHRIGAEVGVPADTILKASHGRRTIDTLKLVAPEKANWDYVREVEVKLPDMYGHMAQEIPGARNFLESVAQLPNPWAIVTSATEPLAHRWFSLLSLPVPDHLVTAESVENGKPDPSCYRLGLERLQLSRRASETLVVEDSPAGIIAAKEAGCKVLALLTTHTEDQILAAGPDWIVADLRAVRVVGGEGGNVVISISHGK